MNPNQAYAPPGIFMHRHYIDPTHAAERPAEAILAALGGRFMQDPASELPRIPLPRTPVNRSQPRIHRGFIVLVTIASKYRLGGKPANREARRITRDYHEGRREVNEGYAPRRSRRATQRR